MTDLFAKIVKRQEEHRKAYDKLKELNEQRWVCDCTHKNFMTRTHCANCSQPRPRFS